MSDAKVQFLNVRAEPVGPGEKPARFSFRCPKNTRSVCGSPLIAEGEYSAPHGIPRDPQGENGGRPQWNWDGNREAPTFQPSIDCEGCWHGYVIKGRCVGTDQTTDEPEPQA